MATLATSDTYISQRASGSPLVAGAHGRESLFPTLGAGVHHPLLPQTGLKSLTFKNKTHTSSSSSSPTPTQVPDLAPFCTRITTRRKQEVEQLLVAMCSIPAVLPLRSMGRDEGDALTVRHRQRGVYVRVGEPRRFRLPGPALMVPRLDDRVRPAPPTTHREDHPGGRCSCLMRAKLGSAPHSSSGSPFLPPALQSIAAPASVSPSPADGVGGGGRCCYPQTTADPHASQLGYLRHPARRGRGLQKCSQHDR